jgi:uncharacterized membrane protein
VEIGIRALSPSINDPHTAVACIDHLCAALAKIAEQELPSEYRFDKMNQLRIVTTRISFSGFADIAFNELRQYGGGSAAIYIRLLEGIESIARMAMRCEVRDALQRHAIMIERAAMRNLEEVLDQSVVRDRFSECIQRLTNDTLSTANQTPGACDPGTELVNKDHAVFE